MPSLVLFLGACTTHGEPSQSAPSPDANSVIEPRGAHGLSEGELEQLTGTAWCLPVCSVDYVIFLDGSECKIVAPAFSVYVFDVVNDESYQVYETKADGGYQRGQRLDVTVQDRNVTFGFPQPFAALGFPTSSSIELGWSSGENQQLTMCAYAPEAEQGLRTVFLSEPKLADCSQEIDSDDVPLCS